MNRDFRDLSWFSVLLGMRLISTNLRSTRRGSADGVILEQKRKLVERS